MRFETDGRGDGGEADDMGDLNEQDLIYIINLDRNDLITLIEMERHKFNKKLREQDKAFSDYRLQVQAQRGRSNTSPFVADDKKDLLIQSLRQQLQDQEKSASERVRQLEEQVSALSQELEAIKPGPTHSPRDSLTKMTKPRAAEKQPNGGLISFNPRKLESQSSIAESTTTSMSDGETDAIGSRVQTLNNTIVSTSTSLTKRLGYNLLLFAVADREELTGVRQSLSRAKWLLGDTIASRLLTQSLPKNPADSDPPALSMQIAFEVALAKWCAIVLGWDQGTASNQEGSEAIIWRRSLKDLRHSFSKSEDWTASITNAMQDVMVIAGWSLKPSINRDWQLPLAPIIAATQNLQKSLDDFAFTSSYSLDIHMLIPGTHFESSNKVMVDAFAPEKHRILNLIRRTSTPDKVIGTTGLGVKCRPPHEGAFVSAPRVVLERTFFESFSSSSDAVKVEKAAPVRVRIGGQRSAAIRPVKHWMPTPSGTC